CRSVVLQSRKGAHSTPCHSSTGVGRQTAHRSGNPVVPHRPEPSTAQRAHLSLMAHRKRQGPSADVLATGSGYRAPGWRNSDPLWRLDLPQPPPVPLSALAPAGGAPCHYASDTLPDAPEPAFAVRP